MYLQLEQLNIQPTVVVTSLKTDHLENTGLRRTVLALLSRSTVTWTEQVVAAALQEDG